MKPQLRHSQTRRNYTERTQYPIVILLAILLAMPDATNQLAAPRASMLHAMLRRSTGRCGTGAHSLLKLQSALEVGKVVGAKQLARLVAPVEERLPHGSREALEPSLAHRLLELDTREGA